MIDWEALSEFLKVFLQLANVIVLGYALWKFLNKPHNTMDIRIKELETKILELEVRLKEFDQSLHQGNDRFKDQERTNEVMQSCMLALIDFELAYCIHTSYEDTEDLMRAKTELRNHLARK